MLALARGEGQSIIIDGTIEVKIVKWSRSSVRIAIQAPREVSVDRDEVWRKMNPGVMTPLEKAEQERNERLGLIAPAHLKFADCPQPVQDTLTRESIDTKRTVIKQIRQGKLVYTATADMDGKMFLVHVSEDGQILGKDPQ